MTSADMLAFHIRFDFRRYGWRGEWLDDPCVIAWLLALDLFDLRLANVAVETYRTPTTGQTVIDWHGINDQPINAQVAVAA